MIFISDVHHGLDSLENLPSDKGPLVILGDLINWIDYRNGDGIATVSYTHLTLPTILLV